jgi:hypothetical protein
MYVLDRFWTIMFGARLVGWGKVLSNQPFDARLRKRNVECQLARLMLGIRIQ